MESDNGATLLHVKEKNGYIGALVKYLRGSWRADEKLRRQRLACTTGSGSEWGSWMLIRRPWTSGSDVRSAAEAHLRSEHRRSCYPVDPHTPCTDVPVANAGKFIAHSSCTSRTRPSVTTPATFRALDAVANIPPNTAVEIPVGALITTT
ncbi:hypothetical protein GQ600_5920 [Phytophthora cactorum]|nr:hypothetical protein GQ600_5920 [Phytophthora cactorum]